MPGSINIANTSDGLLTAPADATALTNALNTAPLCYNGATLDLLRRANVVKNISAVTITAATGATIWTPASGKKFRLLGFCLSASAATSFKFYEGASGAVNLTTLLLQTPIVAAAGVIVVGADFLGQGIRSSTINFLLNLDVSGTTPAVSGFVCGVEE